MRPVELFEQLYPLKGKEYQLYKAGLPVTVLENVDSLCRLFEVSSEDGRLEITSRVVREISFLFLRFSESMATAAIRRNDQQPILRGLEALAIENCRSDWRDSTLALALLYNSAVKLSADADGLIRFVAALAAKAANDLLFIPFLARTPKNRELAKFDMKEAISRDGEFCYSSIHT